MLKPLRRFPFAAIVAAAWILSFLLLAFSGFALASASTDLTGPYLGQTPPGRTPRLFAPGVVSTRAGFEHSAAVFSPDGQELYWCTNANMRSDPPGDGQRLYYMRQVDDGWTAPEIAPFTDGITAPVQRPVFSPDGSRLYIESFSNPTAEADSDIYMVERDHDGWSAPMSVSPLINTEATERLHCVTSDGSLIFSRNPFTSSETIYISRLVDGAFIQPEELGSPFDSAAYELAIVMGPDDSYVLIAASNRGRTDELYVSFRQPDGSWTARIPVPYQSGGFLSLSPDGAYLFFLGEGIYWVDTSFVERLRPTQQNGSS